jgi:hypothetical protein
MLVAALTAGCSAWRPLPGAGRLARAQAEWLGHARVPLRDGTELDLEEAAISPDSIVGLGGAARTRCAVARSDVTRVETRRTVKGRTFLAGVLAPITAAFLYVVAVQATRTN